MEIMYALNIYNKCLHVVTKCKTLEQLKSARNYLELYLKFYNDEESYKLIFERFLILEKKLNQELFIKVFTENENNRKILHF